MNRPARRPDGGKPARIEDYAIIGDTQTAALVGRDGSVDWACLPRFDSGACFAALLGDRDNGCWRVGPRDPVRASRRRYRPDSLVLETELEVEGGAVRLTDFMPIRDERPDIVRIVEGISGTVAMEVELVIRFDMGRVLPWVRQREGALTATAGPDALCLRTDIELHGEEMTTVGRFDLRAGERRAMALTWFPSHQPLPAPLDPLEALRDTDDWWRRWSARCKYRGPYVEAVGTSLRVLKALTFGPTGGIVAAPTTSLPEWRGGVRNWDYRYCWLRDATLTLYAFMLAGYVEEATAWREWLLRAAAGDPGCLQIMYGVAGERRLAEYEVPWLAGFAGSKPVRVGNAAHEQLQLDVYGEVADAMLQARRFGIGPDDWAWSLGKTMLESLGRRWAEPDHGIWEVRGPKRHFTHSKVMAWVAFDRSIKSAEQFGLEGPIDQLARRSATRSAPRSRARGYDSRRRTFTQSYGAAAVDASLLLLPLVGFIPACDPRMLGTVAAIENELLDDGLVRRYRRRRRATDGLPRGEGVFLPCSFWLGRRLRPAGAPRRRRTAVRAPARAAQRRGPAVGGVRPRRKAMLGNFPQAFSHLALVNTAFNLSAHPSRPAQHRGDGSPAETQSA